MTLILQGTGEPIQITPTGPACTIGERINPSGKLKLLQALRDRNWEYVVEEARRQVAAGADIIDVNVGGKGIDEVTLLPEVVRIVANAVDVPLAIDTRVPAALEAALEVCPGRPLVNSIGAERKILSENLPIVSEFKVPIIALCMGQEGIPSSARDRLILAHQVLEAAAQSGIKSENVVFDPLVMTVGADDQAARVALETIRGLREEFPDNSITGGASNVSFGMPARTLLNAGFITVAVVLGMNIPITDPTKTDLRFAIHCADIFSGHDKKNRRFMRYYRQCKNDLNE